MPWPRGVSAGVARPAVSASVNSSCRTSRASICRWHHSVSAVAPAQAERKASMQLSQTVRALWMKSRTASCSMSVWATWLLSSVCDWSSPYITAAVEGRIAIARITTGR